MCFLACRKTRDADENFDRNPWGERSGSGLGEWNGPWSDGSSEWTPYWLEKMDHKFGDDGVFWMSYEDMLNTFMFLHRTRLFDDHWTVVQQWTSANVSWITGYLQSKFEIEVKKSGLVIIALTQLDERYFTCLEGEYRYELHFILQAATEEVSGTAVSNEHICRVRPIHTWENRSVSCEVELEAGRYFVLPKVTASRRDESKSVEQVVKEYADKNPQKLRQIGMQYDLAHARGGVPDEDGLLVSKKEAAKRKKDAKKKKLKEKNRKVLRQAAKAIEKVAIAIHEVAKEEDGTGTKKSAEEKGVVEKSETKDEKTNKTSSEDSTEKTAAPASVTGAESTSAPPAAPSRPESAKAEPTATSSTGPPQDALPPIEKKQADEVVSSSSEATATATPPSDDDDTKSSLAVDNDAADKAVEAPTLDNDEVEEEDDEESDSDSSDSNDSDDEDTPTAPWNAVVVMGLRVYARDAEVTVKLVKAEAPVEANALTMEGQPAGATM